VYTELEIGLIILMVYGFFKKYEENLRAQMCTTLTLVFTLLVAYLAWSGMITFFELTSSISF